MSKLTRDFPMLGSSVDSEKVSLTIKSVVALLATSLAFFGVIVPLSELNPLIDQLGTLVAQIAGVISTALALYGGVRRLFNKLSK